MIEEDNNQLEPIMPLPICPNCGFTQALDRNAYSWYSGDLVCYNCKCRYYIEFGGPTGEYLEKPPKLLELPDKIDPELMEGLTVPSIPKELYEVYEDAARCLGAGVPRGSAVLCRYTVQLALIIKGIPDQPPEKMVNIAHAKGILSETALHQCRAAVFMGGKAGHPQDNWLNNIRTDDARQALLATKRILLELFYPEGLID